MPRKKKDLLDPVMTENPEPEQAPTSPVTEPTAIETRRFVSNAFPHLCLGIKGALHCFKDGELVTDNIDVIQAIEKHPWFKIHIHKG